MKKIKLKRLLFKLAPDLKPRTYDVAAIAATTAAPAPAPVATLAPAAAPAPPSPQAEQQDDEDEFASLAKSRASDAP